MKVAHDELTIPFTEPFTSNRGVLTEVRQRVLTLSWEGLTGYGTALATEAAELEAVVELLDDASPYALQAVLTRLDARGVRPAVRAAVDMALHDLLGKAAEQPLHHLFGLAGLPLAPTGLSIGACPDAELALRGKAVADWPILKLKMTPEDDGSRAGVLRAVYEGRIWVDGNGSWSPGRAVEVAKELHRHGVELFEQPVRPGALDDLRYVHEHSPIPVLADEDCVTSRDVLRLRGAAAGINVKLTKCGGLLAAREMIALARHAGLRVMLGCKVESVLGVTAMAQLGASADYLDLDGGLHLRDDPFDGVRIEHGTIMLPGGPGLGATTELHGDS